MIQAFGDSNGYLGGEAVMDCVDWCTDDGGKTRINQRGAAYNDKKSETFWIIARRFSYAIDLTSFHSAT